MNTNETVLKARALNDQHDCDSVVELLEKYVQGNKDDKEALGLYQKNYVLKTLLDFGVNLEQLYDNDTKNRYQGIPENIVLQMSELIFLKEIADVYISERTDEEKSKSIYAFLKIGITSLGDRLEDYNILKEQLDKFSKIMVDYGYATEFYKYLSIIIDWRSKTSENILRYIVEKVKLLTTVTSEQAIYDNYIKGITSEVFPFSEMPPLSGDRVVIVNIKSQEAKDFWQGYFAYAKRVREEEYETYKKIVADESHELHGVYLADKYVDDRRMQLLQNGSISSMDVANFLVATNYMEISVTESSYKGRIANAEKSYNTVKVNPIEQIKTLINKLLGKK